MATVTTTTASFEPPVPQEMAIPGTHASVMRLVTRTVPPSKGIGAWILAPGTALFR